MLPMADSDGLQHSLCMESVSSLHGRYLPSALEQRSHTAFFTSIYAWHCVCIDHIQSAALLTDVLGVSRLVPPSDESVLVLLLCSFPCACVLPRALAVGI